jgi:hypothetical protein
MDAPPPDINVRAPFAVDTSRSDASWAVIHCFLERVDANFRHVDDFFEISLDIVTERASAALNTVRIWPLSVTESFELSPQTGRS